MHTEAPYSMTFKTTKGNLFTVRGGTAEELATNLAFASVPIATEDGPASVLDMVAEIEKHLSGTVTPGGPPAVTQGSYQPQASLTPACPTCGGATSERKGTNSKGPWTGYFCNSGQKDHKVTWGK